MFENFLLYATRARFYLVAYTADKSAWRFLKLSRSEATELDVVEDPVVYSERQAAALLRTIADGNASVGGLNLVMRACAVVGVIRFLEGYHLLLVTRRRRVGTLAGHAVYAVDDTEARLYLAAGAQAAELPLRRWWSCRIPPPSRRAARRNSTTKSAFPSSAPRSSDTRPGATSACSAAWTCAPTSSSATASL